MKSASSAEIKNILRLQFKYRLIIQYSTRLLKKNEAYIYIFRNYLYFYNISLLILINFFLVKLVYLPVCTKDLLDVGVFIFLIKRYII